MGRRFGTVTIAVGIALLFVSPPPAGATYAAGCHVQGTMTFSPGLSSAMSTFSDRIDATVNGCQTTAPGAGAGTLTAGETYWDSGVPYREAPGTGSGTCLGSSSQGYAIIRWADGFTTVIGYFTDEADGVMHVDGWTVGTVTLKAIPPADGSLTVTSTRYPAPGNVPGILDFLPQPSLCASTSGSTQASIDGVLALATTPGH